MTTNSASGVSMPAIRRSSSSNVELSARYGRNLSGSIPQAINDLRHSLPWPIDMRVNSGANIWHYHDEVVGLSGARHSGIDICGEVGTEVRTPETVEVVDVSVPQIYSKTLADITLYAPGSGLYYIYVHLDASSLSEPLQRSLGLNVFMSGTKGPVIERRGALGKVGEFYFGENHHLHMQFSFLESPLSAYLAKFGSAYELSESPEAIPVNPLLLLEKLY